MSGTPPGTSARCSPAIVEGFVEVNSSQVTLLLTESTIVTAIVSPRASEAEHRRRDRCPSGRREHRHADHLPARGVERDGVPAAAASAGRSAQAVMIGTTRTGEHDRRGEDRARSWTARRRTGTSRRSRVQPGVHRRPPVRGPRSPEAEDARRWDRGEQVDDVAEQLEPARRVVRDEQGHAERECRTPISIARKATLHRAEQQRPDIGPEAVGEQGGARIRAEGGDRPYQIRKIRRRRA